MPPLAILAGLGSVRHKVFHNAARRQGRLRPGDTVVLVAFGAGMTYAGAAIRWDETARGGSAA